MKSCWNTNLSIIRVVLCQWRTIAAIITGIVIAIIVFIVTTLCLVRRDLSRTIIAVLLLWTVRTVIAIVIVNILTLPSIIDCVTSLRKLRISSVICSISWRAFRHDTVVTFIWRHHTENGIARTVACACRALVRLESLSDWQNAAFESILNASRQLSPLGAFATLVFARGATSARCVYFLETWGKWRTRDTRAVNKRIDLVVLSLTQLSRHSWATPHRLQRGVLFLRLKGRFTTLPTARLRHATKVKGQLIRLIDVIVFK